MKPLTSDEMRALENAAMSSGIVTGLELMERAGEGCARATVEAWPRIPPDATSVIVFCGPGNNGGDGFVIARLLAGQGYPTTVFFYGNADKLSADARRNYDVWSDMAVGEMCQLSFPELSDDDIAAIERAYATASPLIVIDALFGIGLDRPLSKLRPLLDAHAARRARQPLMPMLCLAVDVPSGLTDFGPVEQGANGVLIADVTVTFHALKMAHLAGLENCGKVIIHDIGL